MVQQQAAEFRVLFTHDPVGLPAGTVRQPAGLFPQLEQQRDLPFARGEGLG
ncbi:MAG: hypothetical protein HC822_03680 [Oscillochloris sp.]|nr:hypothetical protein [Oscillochloris sp.]